MKYKMVASDFDDTLLPYTGRISEYTQDVIKRYEKAGGRFVLCTGRMFASIKKEADKLGLHGDAIAYQGALTKNLDTGETLDSTSIPADLAVEYVRFMQKFPTVVQVYIDDVLHIEKENPYTARYAEFCGVTPRAVGDLPTFLASNEKPVYKVYCYVAEESCAALRAAAQREFGDRLLVNSSKSWNVEAINVSASKGKAVTNLAARYGFRPDEVMTFGDNLNDLQLVSTGFGVAVGNAVDELKKTARYVSENSQDDGVAKSIEKFCL